MIKNSFAQILASCKEDARQILSVCKIACKGLFLDLHQLLQKLQQLNIWQTFKEICNKYVRILFDQMRSFSSSLVADVQRVFFSFMQSGTVANIETVGKKFFSRQSFDSFLSTFVTDVVSVRTRVVEMLKKLFVDYRVEYHIHRLRKRTLLFLSRSGRYIRECFRNVMSSIHRSLESVGGDSLQSVLDDYRGNALQTMRYVTKSIALRMASRSLDSLVGKGTPSLTGMEFQRTGMGISLFCCSVILFQFSRYGTIGKILYDVGLVHCEHGVALSGFDDLPCYYDVDYTIILASCLLSVFILCMFVLYVYLKKQNRVLFGIDLLQ